MRSMLDGERPTKTLWDVSSPHLFRILYNSLPTLNSSYSFQPHAEGNTETMDAYGEFEILLQVLYLVKLIGW